MDFSFTEEQDAVKELAAQILDGQLGNDALKEFDKSGAAYDAGTWAEFAAGPRGPNPVRGFGFVAAALVLEQIAVLRHPVLLTVVLGAPPIAEFGTDSSRRPSSPAWSTAPPSSPRP